MKYIVILLVLVLLAAGGFFLFTKYYKPAAQNFPSEQTNCTTGLEGNSGDNYCSNTYKPSSKCLPRTENTYPDGCTQ